MTAQKALVDSLGITKLYAIMGLSIGGIQSFESAWYFLFHGSRNPDRRAGRKRRLHDREPRSVEHRRQADPK